MPHIKTNIIRIGKESTRGTAVAGALTVPFKTEGLKPSLQQNLAAIASSSTFPHTTSHEPVGLSSALTLSPEVNVATIRDLLEMAITRDPTTTLLPSLTIEETSVGVGQQKFAGCICQSLEFSFQRSNTPDDSALLAAQMQFAAMSVASASGITAGTYGMGNPFQIRHSAFEINSVTAEKILSFRWRITNSLWLGPHGSNDALVAIVDGEQTHELELSAVFDSEAWRDLVKNATKHVAQVVLATGTSTEDVTLDLGAVQTSGHDPAEDSGTVTEQITLMPAHTGSVAPVVVTFGAGIGAGVLNID